MEDKILTLIRAQMNAGMEQCRLTIEEATFNPKHEQLERLARGGAHHFFGDIVNPSPDPLKGLKDLLNDK